MSSLTPRDLAAEWKKGSFRPVYYFFGEDAGSKNSAIQVLRRTLQSDDFNTSEFSGDSDDQAEEIASTCLTPPMFSARRLVIVRNIHLGVRGRKRLADYLRAPLETTTLVMSTDDKKPTAKDVLAAGVQALGGIVLFEPLSPGKAVARLQEEACRAGFELAPDAAELLVEESGSAWGILRSELKKIQLFVQGRPSANVDDVAACLGYRQQTDLFDLPRSLEKRDAARALDVLRCLLREGHSPFSLLFRVTQTVRKQLKAHRMVKSGAPQDKIARELRMRYVQDYLNAAARLGEPRLILTLKDCLETEIALKSKSWLDASIELENLVLKVCGKA
ncbi:MAG: DNA polymerase III subunit delta [Elusimicrobiota bacterium]